MNLTPFVLLVGIALILGVVSLVKPSWPTCAIALVFVCVALLINK